MDTLFALRHPVLSYWSNKGLFCVSNIIPQVVELTFKCLFIRMKVRCIQTVTQTAHVATLCNLFRSTCLCGAYSTLSWPAGHILSPTYKESFQVRWDNSITLFLHAAIYLEVSLFRWTSQNTFSRETAVLYKWYCVQCCVAALHTVSFVHGRPDHDQQHCYHHAPTVKPEAATAVVELLMMGVRTRDTCWAVHKRQVINLRNCCIWLVDLFELL
jgi:hypothetical protein